MTQTELDNIMAQVKGAMGAAQTLTLPSTDPKITAIWGDVHKAKVRVHLTRNAQIAISFNLAQNTVTFTVIGSALPSPTPAPTPAQAQAGNPFPEKVNRVPVLRKVQHSYRPPHMLKDIISVLADEASHVIWFKGPTGSGKCIVGDSMVLTDKGILRMDEIVPSGDDVYRPFSGGVFGIHGDEPATQTYSGGKKPCFGVTTRHGYEISGTAKHRIVYAGDDGMDWRALPDLKIGDSILVRVGTEMFGSEGRNDIPFAGSDWEVGYFIGAWTGDGNVTGRPRKKGWVWGTTKITVGKNEEPGYVDRLVKIIKTVTGRTARVYNDKTAFSVCVFGQEIATWLENNVGHGADNKHVPSAVLRSSREVQRGFLSGLFDTDGCNDGTTIELGSNSRELVRVVQVMLANMGIVSYRIGRPNRKGFRLYIRGESLRRFVSDIGFTLKRKAGIATGCGEWTSIWNVPVPANLGARLYHSLKAKYTAKKAPAKDFWTYKKRGHIGRAFVAALDDGLDGVGELKEMARECYFWDTVKSVDSIGEKEVFDLVVPGTNSFVANSIVNHNTVAAHYIAKALGRQLFQINCHYGMGPESLVGERSISIDEKTGQNYISYIEGTVVKAMQCGLDRDGNEVGTPGLLFIDEAGAMPTQVAIMLNRLLESDDPRRTITLEHDGGRVIRSHSGFRLILAANTCGRGANTMAEAFYTAQTDALDISLLNRIAAVFKFGYDKEAEKGILLEKTNDRVAQQVIRFRDAIRDALRAGRLSTPFSTRHIVKIADLYRIFNDIPKAIYLATMEQLLPQEMVIFNETIMAQFGKDIVKEITQDDVDYM